jgi:hypothetical protein
MVRMKETRSLRRGDIAWVSMLKELCGRPACCKGVIGQLTQVDDMEKVMEEIADWYAKLLEGRHARGQVKGSKVAVKSFSS